MSLWGARLHSTNKNRKVEGNQQGHHGYRNGILPMATLHPLWLWVVGRQVNSPLAQH